MLSESFFTSFAATASVVQSIATMIAENNTFAVDIMFIFFCFHFFVEIIYSDKSVNANKNGDETLNYLEKNGLQQYIFGNKET